MFKTFFSKLWTLLVVAGAYLVSSPIVLAAQTADERCTAFKAQFGGAFDWVPVQICTANGLVYFELQAFLMIIGVVAVVFIMIGGFWYLTSAGNEEQAEKGRKTLVNAVIGLAVVLLAVMIVRVVVNTLGVSR
jgi:hypothetical protein